MVIPLLLDGGASASAKDNRGQTPLHRLLGNPYYFGEDFLGLLRLFLEHGVDVNAEDQDHTTPLYWAIYHRKLEVVPVLLDHGASPNSENYFGETPLHLLVKDNYFSVERHLSTVKLLLEHGANRNAQDKNGVTPLQLISGKGLHEVAHLFRIDGTNDATENDHGQTPFARCACKFNDNSVLRS